MNKFNGDITIKDTVAKTPLHYSSLAFPPDGIDMSHTFYFCNDNGECYLIDNGIKRDYSLNFIKCFFSPNEGSWEDIVK